MTVRFGAFALDSDRRQLTRDDVEIHLTPKAFDLLALLADEAPRVVRKRELHERLWPGTFVSDAALVVLVKELRRALEDRDAATPIIRTAHGVGYACAVPIDRGPVRSTPVSRWIVAGGRRIALTTARTSSAAIPRRRCYSTSRECHVVTRRSSSMNATPSSRISAARTVRESRKHL